MAWVKNNIFSTRHYWYSPTSWRVVARGFWRLLAVARLQKRYTRLHQKPPLGVSRLAQSPKFAWWFVYKEGDPSPSKSKSHICEICWLQREVTAFTLKANGRLSRLVNDHPGVLYSPQSPGRRLCSCGSPDLHPHTHTCGSSAADEAKQDLRSCWSAVPCWSVILTCVSYPSAFTCVFSHGPLCSINAFLHLLVYTSLDLTWKSVSECGHGVGLDCPGPSPGTLDPLFPITVYMYIISLVCK